MLITAGINVFTENGITYIPNSTLLGGRQPGQLSQISNQLQSPAAC